MVMLKDGETEAAAAPGFWEKDYCNITSRRKKKSISAATSKVVYPNILSMLPQKHLCWLVCNQSINQSSSPMSNSLQQGKPAAPRAPKATRSTRLAAAGDRRWDAQPHTPQWHWHMDMGLTVCTECSLVPDGVPPTCTALIPAMITLQCFKHHGAFTAQDAGEVWVLPQATSPFICRHNL